MCPASWEHWYCPIQHAGAEDTTWSEEQTMTATTMTMLLIVDGTAVLSRQQLGFVIDSQPLVLGVQVEMYWPKCLGLGEHSAVDAEAAEAIVVVVVVAAGVVAVPVVAGVAAAP